ncbi:LAGLIDADG family homing endonuclease [Streptomyces sp. NPDC086782]|uniref:LAGLIDADG family homing endonuclease n=1 Tax=Streptomyces sp. NPDC086782 TaxID=3365757 RepID=UPI0037F7810E
MGIKLKTRKPTGIVPWPLVLIEGDEGSGKAQPLDSLVATPTGWTRMGDLTEGSTVIGSDGRTTTVTGVFDRGELPIYRVTTSDGATVEAAGDHLWRVWTAEDRHRKRKNGEHRNHEGRVLTTDAIAELIKAGRVIHLPMVQPVQYEEPDTPLPLEPYLLGLLIGDGGMTQAVSFFSADPELHAAVQAALPERDILRPVADDPRNPYLRGGATLAALRELGLQGHRSEDKFIPEPYKRASVEDRLALLRGLMDTDGGMEKAGALFYTSSGQLAADVRELVESLGGTASTSSKTPKYRTALGEVREGLLAFRLRVRLPEGVCPFTLARKAERWRDERPKQMAMKPWRIIKQLTYIGTKPARCIRVAAEDHLYVTEHFIVTHNTYSAAEFSACDRIGQMYWIDLAEGSADEYAAIPGADYLIIEHDGSYRDILEQIRAVHTEARRAALAGEAPVVLSIDSGTALWRMLKTWTNERARRGKSNAQRLQDDPDSAIEVGMNLWNDATERWIDVIHLLQTFPGIAIITARGKQITAIDDNGRPVTDNRGRALREWKVQAQKDLAFDCSVWVRLRRGRTPQVIKARSLQLRVEDGKPLNLPDFSIEDLVFNRLGCSLDSQPRQMPALVGDRVQGWLDAHQVEDLRDVERLRELWWEAADDDTGLTRAEIVSIRNTIEQKVTQIENPPTEMGQGPASDADKLRAAVERRAEAEGDEPDDEPDPDRRPVRREPAKRTATKRAAARS